jgi:hypothetical protein
MRYREQYHIEVGVSYVLDTDVMVAPLRSDRGASRQLLLGLEFLHFSGG